MTDSTTVDTNLSADAEEASAREAFNTSFGQEAEPQTSESSAQQSADRAADKPADAVQDVATDGDESRSSEASADKDKQEQADKKAAEKARDDKGRFRKAEAESADTGKAESKYQKARKDADRYDRNWKKFQEDQERFRQEREQFERERGTAASNQQPQTPNRLPFNSQQLLQAANEFGQKADKLLTEGDADGAKEQIDLARKAYAAAQENGQAEYQEAQKQFESKWTASAAEVLKATPDLSDPENGLRKEIDRLFEENQWLLNIEHGFKLAHDYVAANHAAAEASGLREENKQLKAKLKEFEERTSLTRGGPTKAASPADFDDMNDDEQEEFLRNQTRAKGFVTGPLVSV